jgi:hypothetical protein
MKCHRQSRLRYLVALSSKNINHKEEKVKFNYFSAVCGVKYDRVYRGVSQVFLLLLLV